MLLAPSDVCIPGDPLSEGALTLPTVLFGLTLQQPWATAIRDLGKRVENRSWRPPDRLIGEVIALHAGRVFQEDAADWLAARTGRMVQRSTVPLGAIMALARIKKVVTDRANDPWFVGPYGWVLEDVMPLPPLPCQGRQRLWRVPQEVRTQIEQILAAQSQI